MASRGVAKRYAEAVFDLAKEAQNFDGWLADLRILAELAEDDQSRRFFANPAISEDAKNSAIREFLSASTDTGARNLARLLIHRGRFEELPIMYEVFEDLVLQEQGVAVANVTTAIELTDEEQQQISTGLQRLIGRDVRLRPVVDEAIIGGLVARIGDQMLDGSVRSQLRQMRTRLSYR